MTQQFHSEVYIYSEVKTSVHSSIIHDNQTSVNHSNVSCSMDKQNGVYLYNGIVFEKHTVLIYATTWMNLENILFSERSQSQRTTYYMIPFRKCAEQASP